jgi:hypothetical protein
MTAGMGSNVLPAIGRPWPLGRTRQVCIHCRENPAGFWVGHSGGVTRRPWCLSCCQELDRTRSDIVPFDSQVRQNRRDRRASRA